MTKSFKAYLNLDKTGLEHKYAVIVNGEVVVHGEDIESMLEKVGQKYPDDPIVAKVLDERMLIL